MEDQTEPVASATDAEWPAQNGSGNLLDHLGALREQRAAQTVQDFAVPGYQGHLWVTARLLPTGRISAYKAAYLAGRDNLTGMAAELVSEAVKAIFVADGEDDDGAPYNPQPVPGCEDVPLGLDDRMDRYPQLCPPRPANKAHTPATRARAMLNNDGGLTDFAFMLCGWMSSGAQQASARFHPGASGP